MPPAKGKKSTKKVIDETPKVELPPVIFFLRIGKEFDFDEERVDVPIAATGGPTQYSDILQTTETQERRFDEAVIHDLMT